MYLQDKVIVVNGVGPDMGRQIALRGAAAGADVVLAARTASRLEEVAAEVKELGRRALVVPTDMTVEADVQHLA
jgi:NAD(P)-dependent dehydrogenase (short-subunit alcohol dehydrogenase family)